MVTFLERFELNEATTDDFKNSFTSTIKVLENVSGSTLSSIPFSILLAVSGKKSSKSMPSGASAPSSVFKSSSWVEPTIYTDCFSDVVSDWAVGDTGSDASCVAKNDTEFSSSDRASSDVVVTPTYSPRGLRRSWPGLVNTLAKLTL